MRFTCGGLVALCALCWPVAESQAQTQLQITSPATGAIFFSGQTVLVSVAADPPIANVVVIGTTPLNLADGPDSSGRFALTIPVNTPIGQYEVTAVGSSGAAGLVQSQPIVLAVESPLSIVSLTTTSDPLHFDAPGIFMPIRAIAMFSDGSQGDVSRSVNTTYESANPAVAIVDAQGVVTAVSPGSATITVTVTGLVTTVGVMVEQASPPAAGDILPPRTLLAISPPPNATGWNNSNVTINLSAADEQTGSGVESIRASLVGAQNATYRFAGNSANFVISTEGTTIVSYFAIDNAGNKEKRNTLAVHLDKTPPIIVPSRSPAPNANGWNNSDVAVSFSCTDSLSGVAPNGVSGPTVLASEGAGQQVTGTCTDIAGNEASIAVGGINIDKSPPILSGLPSECTLWPPNHRLVQVATIIASDSVSGLGSFNVSVASSEPQGEQPEFVISGGALQPQVVQLRAERSGSGTGRVYTITASATDLAGNAITSSSTCTVPHDLSGH